MKVYTAHGVPANVVARGHSNPPQGQGWWAGRTETQYAGTDRLEQLGSDPESDSRGGGNRIEQQLLREAECLLPSALPGHPGLLGICPRSQMVPRTNTFCSSLPSPQSMGPEVRDVPVRESHQNHGRAGSRVAPTHLAFEDRVSCAVLLG